MKISEDGRYLVLRLAEQDGKRGKLRFPVTVAVMNMLEDAEKELPGRREAPAVIEYRPFEILTLGVRL